MTRPHIIRADSIDLQDPDAPSAKDHRGAAVKPILNSHGSLAPHQAETIREVEEERAEEELRSPRVSWANAAAADRDLQQYAEDLSSGIASSLNGTTMQQQDALAIAQNGGVSGHGEDDGDVDNNTDDDLDDDMMDRISSSPSIIDGGYTLPPVWPARIDSLINSPLRNSVHGSPSRRTISRDSSPMPSEARSSSPYLEPAPYPPLQNPRRQLSKASAPSPPPSRSYISSERVEWVSEDDYPCSDSTVVYAPGPDPNPDPNSDSTPETSGSIEDSGSVSVLEIQHLSDLESPTCGRDSAVDLKVEDFSLEEHPPDEHEVRAHRDVSPYGFPVIPYDESEDEEEDGFAVVADSRFVVSGWGGECLQDSEDIDFEFVYALHTFVATVEGQANATKGDTMVLLDDSNSYWWLVRVVKDSSIGYLPAEHIETPTERLARLNKHRNVEVSTFGDSQLGHHIDFKKLSSTTLSDHDTKPKNAIKSALRRHKTKNVTFTAPTYVDYEEIDYSDDEDEENDTQGQQDGTQQDGQRQQQAAEQQAAAESVEDDESAKVEPLKPRTQKQVKLDSSTTDGASQLDPDPRNSDEIFDGKNERVSRNGTVRNTDSFFRDETIETKKISLTPGLLRDDNEPRMSNDSRELRQRPSLEKELVSDKNRDDKKKKEKKPSAIRSFFSRKDKKKSVDDDDESFGKRSNDFGGSFGDAEMADEPEDMDGSPQKGPSRNPSKLQKTQRKTEPSPTRRPGPSTATLGDTDLGPPLAADVRTNNVANVPPATLRMVESEHAEGFGMQTRKEDKAQPAITKISPTNSEPKPHKVTKAKSRVELDDFDSSTEEEMIPEPTRPAPVEPRDTFQDKILRPTLPGSFPDSYVSAMPQNEAISPPEEGLSDAPTQVSPITPSDPPALMGDTSSQEDRSSPVSSSSPELIDTADSTHRNQDSMTTSTSATTTSTWNDANLRAFFESGSEVRDLLVVVYDKTDIPPAGPDHPVAGPLFREQNAKLAEITTQLDNMLGDYLARKQRLRGTV
ncbi:hypothetical protein F5Y18DRAFT_333033 [Xylariaceae sp. FL1019]|nr:hypothetical protein F5Y18DRAFT_333033 [Xylariaceae sp. FL1019]